MTSLAVSGIGTRFRRLNGSVYEDIAEVKSISGPSMSRETIDVTSLDSTGGYREFIPGLRDGGDYSFTMNFTRDGYDAMKADFESDVLVEYEVILADQEHTSFEFSGYVTALPLDIPMDDAITCEVTIKVNGPVTINSGSASA